MTRSIEYVLVVSTSLFLGCSPVISQRTVTLTGELIDAETGDPVSKKRIEIFELLPGHHAFELPRYRRVMEVISNGEGLFTASIETSGIAIELRSEHCNGKGGGLELIRFDESDSTKYHATVLHYSVPCQ